MQRLIQQGSTFWTFEIWISEIDWFRLKENVILINVESWKTLLIMWIEFSIGTWIISLK